MGFRMRWLATLWIGGISCCSCASQSLDMKRDTHPVNFEFYSSGENEMLLAYKYDLMEDWKLQKMARTGFRFSTELEVEKEVWYEFVSPATNTWYKKDPLNPVIDQDHPYLRREAAGLLSNRNPDIHYFSSEHFDYFTTDAADRTAELEERYCRIAAHLAMLEVNPAPIAGKNIRYYSKLFGGMYSLPASAEVVDDIDIINAHEIIHLFLHNVAKYPPLAEGHAQCFQEYGNRKPLREANVNLAAKEKIRNQDLLDVMEHWQEKADYHLIGSFVYYHWFVDRALTPGFIDLSKKLTSDRTSYADFKGMYRESLKRDIEKTVGDWKNWLAGIDENSDVYVNWN